jgi:hypothetical protein
VSDIRAAGEAIRPYAGDAKLTIALIETAPNDAPLDTAVAFLESLSADRARTTALLLAATVVAMKNDQQA